MAASVSIYSLLTEMLDWALKLVNIPSVDTVFDIPCKFAKFLCWLSILDYSNLYSMSFSYQILLLYLRYSQLLS